MRILLLVSFLASAMAAEAVIRAYSEGQTARLNAKAKKQIKGALDAGAFWSLASWLTDHNSTMEDLF